jgi:hypothetical protein
MNEREYAQLITQDERFIQFESGAISFWFTWKSFDGREFTLSAQWDSDGNGDSIIDFRIPLFHEMIEQIIFVISSHFEVPRQVSHLEIFRDDRESVSLQLIREIGLLDFNFTTRPVNLLLRFDLDEQSLLAIAEFLKGKL